jgi:hypothetical protein
MAKQVMEAPMAGCGTKGMKKGYKMGGMVKKMGESSKTMSDADKRYAMGGMVGYAKGGKVDQSMCSPRKQMAMGKKAMK